MSVFVKYCSVLLKTSTYNSLPYSIRQSFRFSLLKRGEPKLIRCELHTEKSSSPKIHWRELTATNVDGIGISSVQTANMCDASSRVQWERWWLKTSIDCGKLNTLIKMASWPNKQSGGVCVSAHNTFKWLCSHDSVNHKVEWPKYLQYSSLLCRAQILHTLLPLWDERFYCNKVKWLKLCYVIFWILEINKMPQFNVKGAACASPPKN